MITTGSIIVPASGTEVGIATSLPLGQSVCVLGRGGAGKTTTAQRVLRAAVRRGWRVFAVDADPQMGLTLSLMLDEGWRIEPDSDSLRDFARRGMARGRAGLAGQIRASIVRRPDYDLLPMARVVGEGCYCGAYSVVCEIVRAATPDYDLTILDAVAGSEPVSRGLLAAGGTALVVAGTDRLDLLLADAILGTIAERQPAARVLRVLNRVAAGVSVPDDWQNAVRLPLGEWPQAVSDDLLNQIAVVRP